jgi:hypothetical protein
VAISEAGAAVTRFDFAGGPMRGSHLTLYATCLVHRGDFHLETLPLASVAAVRVAFERSTRRMGWGSAWIVVGLLLFAASGPLGMLAGSAAGEVASGTTGVAVALGAFFRFLEVLARVLPFLAALAGIGGAALVAFGWFGSTTLTLTFAGGMREYPVRGRDTRLLDFAEALSERVGERLAARR